MRTRHLAPVLLLITTLAACGDTSSEEAPATAPLPADQDAADDAVLFDDDFESGETESWESDEAADGIDPADIDGGSESTGDDG